MAVTPQSLIALTTTEQDVVTKAEAAIDIELRLKFVPNLPTKIRFAIIDFVFDENPRVLDSIISRFTAVGWKITEYDGVNGKWLNFAV